VTTRRTPTKSTAVADFEARAKEAQSSYDAARAVRQQRAEDFAAAQTAFAWVHASWDAGDDSLPADAEVQAQAQLSRASRLLAAAEVVERKARAQLVNVDTTLATALLPFVTAVLRTTPSVQPFRPTDKPTSLPAAVVVQEKASQVDARSGRLSGAVDVIFSREAVHREADASEFEAAAEAHGVLLRRVQVYTTHDGGQFVDAVRLDVAGVHLAVPVVAPADVVSAAREVCFDVMGRVRDETRYTDNRGPLMPMDNGRRLGMAFEFGKPVVSSDNVGSDGIRRLALEVDFTGKPAKWLGLERGQELIEKAITAQQSRAIDGLGRVEKASVTSSRHFATRESRDGRPVPNDTVTVRARFTVVSRAPEGVELDDPDDDMGSPAPPAVPAQRKRTRDPLEDDGTDSHPGTVAAQ
jgi:hypothetical protein